MLVTEEEAHERFCPLCFPRTATGEACIGRTCMAWRWVKDIGYEFKLVQVKDEMTPPELPDGWEYHRIVRDGWAEYRRDLTRRGYCGLAGKPEEL